jgi:anti-anti-sigma regulatory factor
VRRPPQKLDRHVTTAPAERGTVAPDMAARGSAVSKIRGGGDVWVITLAGSGLPAATELHTELEDLLGAGARSVVVELADAPVDLTVVGVLLASLRRLSDADGQLVLVAQAGDDLRVAGDSLRLDEFFRVERSLPAALAASDEGPVR